MEGFCGPRKVAYSISEIMMVRITSYHPLEEITPVMISLWVAWSTIRQQSGSHLAIPTIDCEVVSWTVSVRLPVMCTLTSFMIHDSLGFTKIHVDSIQLIYDELPNGIKIMIHKSGEQHRRFNSQFNSPMIAYTRFNSIQFNKKQDSTHLWCVQLSQVLFVISYITLHGFLPKSLTFLTHDNTGTQTWEYSALHFCECYTIEMQNETATASATMYGWKFPMCSSLAQKRWIVIVKWSRFLDSFW